MSREQFTIIIDKDFLFPGGLAQYNYRLHRHEKYWTDGTFKAPADEGHIELLRIVISDVERKVKDADNGNGS